MDLPLTREEFADALRKGKGRAMMHVRTHGDDGIADLIRDACIHSYAYDQQSEGDRGLWMMEMVSMLPSRQTYIEAVLAAFVDCVVDRDLEQLVSMLGELARQGRSGVLEMLYSKLERPELEVAYTIAPSILEVGGLDTLLRLARVLGRRLASDPRFYVDGYMAHIIEETTGEGGSALLKATAGDVDIERFTTALDEADGTPIEQPRLDLAGFLAAIAERGRRGRGLSYRFGRDASPDELAQALDIAEQTDDPVVAMCLLSAFRLVDAPGGAGRLLPFARSEDADVREAAVVALARYQHDDIAELSTEWLAAGSLDGIRLMGCNYRTGQFARVAALLPEAGSDDRIHHLGFEIVAVCREQLRPEAQDCLLWVYENTPCSFCRSSVVRDLVELGLLPEALALECRDDCMVETRELVGADAAPTM